MVRGLDRQIPLPERHQEGGGGIRAAERASSQETGNPKVLQAGCVSDVRPDLSHFTEVPGPLSGHLRVCGDLKENTLGLWPQELGSGITSFVCSRPPFSLGCDFMEVQHASVSGALSVVVFAQAAWSAAMVTSPGSPTFTWREM